MGQMDQILELAKKIEEHPPVDPESGEEINGFLGKFVVVSEWMDVQGNKYLVRRSGNGMGEAVATWDVNGMLFEGLHGHFFG